MADYPTALPVLTDEVGGAADPLNSPSLPAWALHISQEVEAIAAELGTSPSAAFATVAARLDALQALDADLTDLGSRWSAASASGPAQLAFREDTDNGTNQAVVKAPASMAADQALTLPDETATLAPLARAYMVPIYGYYNQVGTWDAGAANDMHYIENSSAAQNDELTWEIPLVAGTYTLRMLSQKASSGGICTIYVDGGVLGTTVDQYAAALSRAVTSITGITVAKSGLHPVRVVMATKNASSSGYVGRIAHVAMLRTGA